VSLGHSVQSGPLRNVLWLFRCGAVCCSVWAVCCRVLQCVAMCCSPLTNVSWLFCYTPEIHHIDTLRVLSISLCKFNLRFWFQLNLCRGIWVWGFGGFRGCSTFSGIGDGSKLTCEMHILSICETWLMIHAPHSCVRRDLWDTYTCVIVARRRLRSEQSDSLPHHTYERVTSHIECQVTLVTRSYVWRDSFICVMWLIHMCDVGVTLDILCVSWLWKSCFWNKIFLTKYLKSTLVFSV